MEVHEDGRAGRRRQRRPRRQPAVERREPAGAQRPVDPVRSGVMLRKVCDNNSFHPPPSPNKTTLANQPPGHGEAEEVVVPVDEGELGEHGQHPLQLAGHRAAYVADLAKNKMLKKLIFLQIDAHTHKKNLEINFPIL